MKIESVAESFATYHAKVIPAGASADQVTECRRAFYAGAYFLLMNLVTAIGDDQVSEDEGVDHLDELKRECEAFAAAGGMPLPTPTVVEAPPARVVIDQNYTTPDAAEFRPLLQDMGKRIADALPPDWGFTLLLFPFGPDGSLFYISNAQRENILTVMREFINRQVQ